MAATEAMHTTADPVTARDVTFRTLGMEGFQVKPTSDFSAVVERGSKSATLLVGAMAGSKSQHHRFNIEITAAPEGGSVVSLTRTTSGFAAGAIGVSRARAATKEYVNKIYWALPH